MVPVPVAVKVTDEVPVTPALRMIESLVPLPTKATKLPVSAPATVMLPELLVALRFSTPTVEAFRVIAAAESVMAIDPPALKANVAAAVLTFKIVGEPAIVSEVLLPELLRKVVPVVLAVTLVALLTTLKVAALPARVTELVLAALLT